MYFSFGWACVRTGALGKSVRHLPPVQSGRVSLRHSKVAKCDSWTIVVRHAASYTPSRNIIYKAVFFQYIFRSSYQSFSTTQFLFVGIESWLGRLLGGTRSQNGRLWVGCIHLYDPFRRVSRNAIRISSTVTTRHFTWQFLFMWIPPTPWGP